MSSTGESKKLLAAAKRAGATVKRSKRGAHQKVYVEGRLVTVVGMSGGKGRNGDLLASRRALRKAGLEL